MRDHRAVAELDHAMDDRLGVHQHLDLVRIQIEKMISLNHFEALVHQGCRIDRDLRAHRPIGVLERGLQRRLADLVLRPGPERPARRRDDDLGDVLAPARRPAPGTARCAPVDRQHGCAGLLGAAHEQRTGANQPLLVGKRKRGAALDRREGGSKPGRARDRADHPCRRDGALPPRPRRTRPPPRCWCRKTLISARRKLRDRPPPRNCAPSSRASLAEAAPFLCAVSASTVNRPFWRLSKSMVLDPIEPVAPRIVTLRTAAGFGLRASSIRHQNHQTSRPRAGASRPPRIKPTMAAAAAAVKNPSRRSMTPPWPGMSCTASLAPNCALDRGFEQIAGLRYHRQKPAPQGPASARPTSRASFTRSGSPPLCRRAFRRRRPDHVLFGLTAGQSFGPPSARPAK